MPPLSDKPLRKVTLNLFEDDIAYLERAYGHGWTTEVRGIVERFVRERRLLQASLRETFNEHR